MLDRRNERKALVRSITIQCLKMGFCFLTSSTQKIKTSSTSQMRTLSQAKRKKTSLQKNKNSDTIKTNNILYTRKRQLPVLKMYFITCSPWKVKEHLHSKGQHPLHAKMIASRILKNITLKPWIMMTPLHKNYNILYCK
jgi:hypothetical protein